MVYLYDIMSLDLLDEMIDGGYVTARPHNSLPLYILNYTPKAQYEWVWNEVTSKARGLIYRSETFEVVSRPFEKFFNWDQGMGKETWQNPMPPAGPCIRMEKMDGSLGILYQHAKQTGCFVEVNARIATRGSFHSEQAEWATGFYHAQIEQMHAEFHESGKNFFNPHPSKTYLFEIIYPENRIVVDYGPYRGLMLIDVIDNETGKSDLQEFDDCEWPDKVVRRVLNLGFNSGQAAEIPDGDEGFVYLWPLKNYRVKMKSADYIELHKLISHLSEKSIWEQLVAGKTIDQIKAGLPDEFYGFVDDTYKSIMDNVSEILRTVNGYMRRYEDHGYTNSRKDFALAIKDNPYKKYLFLALDGKPIYPVALAASKPVTNRALVSTEDI